MPVNDQKHLPSFRLRRLIRWSCAGLLTAVTVVLSIHPANGQHSPAPGVRQATPGVGVSDRRTPVGELSYYGILGAVQRASVYSSPQTAVSLAVLVESAGGLNDQATRMAHVIRDGRDGLRVLWTPDSTERLLPGDVVVFQDREQAELRLSHGSAEAAGLVPDALGDATSGTETVAVAFVGLIDRRPIVVPLDKRFATVPHVLSALMQREDAIHAVRVISSVPRRETLGRRQHPQGLIDGDVLIFDRNQLDIAALVRSQADAQTAFPPAVPLLGNRDVDPFVADRSVPPTDDSTASSVPVTEAPPLQGDALATTEVSGASAPFVDVALPKSADMVPAKRQTSEKALESAAAATGAVRSPALWVAEPEPTLASSERTPTPSTSEPAPTLASLIDPAELVLNNPLTMVGPSDFPSLAEPLPSLAAELIPAPIEPTAARPDLRNSPKQAVLNPLALAVGVLALAAMCFAVSVIWSRFDRAAQSLQQPISALRSAADAPASRRILDRLISNNLPIIEEHAQLPDRMDYHGEELGRRRLMLDQPHGLAGPHFAVSADAGGPDQESGLAASNSFMEIGGRDPDSTNPSRHDSPMEPVGPSPLLRRVDGREEMSDREASTTEVRESGERRPPSRLLERVLIAMERERRR
ncbi:MAG: hypothetical protein AB7U20_25940 [Planctomycetaceae bacterium]